MMLRVAQNLAVLAAVRMAQGSGQTSQGSNIKSKALDTHGSGSTPPPFNLNGGLNTVDIQALTQSNLESRKKAFLRDFYTSGFDANKKRIEDNQDLLLEPDIAKRVATSKDGRFYFGRLPIQMRLNKDVVLTVLSWSYIFFYEYNSCFINLEPTLSKDKAFMLEIFQKVGKVGLYCASDEMKDDNDFALALLEISDNSNFLLYLSNRLLKDKEFMSAVLIKHGVDSFLVESFIKTDPKLQAISTLLRWVRETDSDNFKEFDKKSLWDKNVAARVANEMFLEVAAVSDVPSSINTMWNNSPLLEYNDGQYRSLPKMIGVWILQCIPPDQWAPIFTSKVLPHLPFVFRDQLLLQERFDLQALLPSRLSFVESDPDVFIEPFAGDLRKKQVEVLSHRSLYQINPTYLEAGTQGALYTAQRPTVLIISSDHIHSGHNDLLQDRRWLGRKISDEIKIVIVGDYSDLTPDVQNRIEGEYMDEYSVKTEKPKTEPQSAAQDHALTAFQALPILPGSKLLRLDFRTIEEQSSTVSPSSNKILVLQNPDEWATLQMQGLNPGSVARFLQDRLLSLPKRVPPFKSKDIVIYQYRSSFESHLMDTLGQQEISVEDVDRVKEYFKQCIILIPQSPKLDILSNIRYSSHRWEVALQDSWYPVRDVHTHNFATLATPKTSSYPYSKDLLYNDYFYNNPLFVPDETVSVAKGIYDRLTNFIDSDGVITVLEGPPASGKDAYTQQFISSLKKYAYRLYSEHITAAQDQSLLEQVVTIFNKNSDKSILLQVSEFNLISPEQLNELLYFCHGKPIKIIGTQNDEKQIKNRFRFNNRDIPVLRTWYEDPSINKFFAWVQKKHGVWLSPKLEKMIDFLSWEDRDKHQITPRQHIYLAGRMKRENLNNPDARAGLAKIVNTVYFRKTDIVFLPLKGVVDSRSPEAASHGSVPMDAGSVAVPLLNGLPLADIIQREGQLPPTDYQLTPGDSPIPSIWQGNRSAFLEYKSNVTYSVSQVSPLPGSQQVEAPLNPDKIVVLPSLIGSPSGVITFLNEQGQLLNISLAVCESMVDRADNTVRNRLDRPIRVQLSFNESLPFYRMLSATNQLGTRLDFSDDALNMQSLKDSEKFILKRFIFEKLGVESEQRSDLLAALGLPKKSVYTEQEYLEGIFRYFAAFADQGIPEQMQSGNRLYDSLYFQGGVCRHQAELGRLIFSALGLPVEKKVTLNHLGHPIHDYLVLSLNDRTVVMDFTYKSHIQQKPDELNLSMSDDESAKCSNPDYPITFRSFTPDFLKGYSVPDLSVSSVWSWASNSMNFLSADTPLQPVSSDTPSLSVLLRGPEADWIKHKSNLMWMLLDRMPSQGTMFETRFVPADSSLDDFGVPVYRDSELIGYKVQRETPVKFSAQGILLAPDDPSNDWSKDAVLLLTQNGLTPLNDYQAGSDLIVGSGTTRKRALELVSDLSSHLGIPSWYQAEFEQLTQPGIPRKTGNLRGRPDL